MKIEIFAKQLLDVIDLPLNDPRRIEVATKARGAIQNFFKEAESKKVNAFIQNVNNNSVGVSTDLARVNRDSYNFIMDVGEYDNAWEAAFKNVPVASGQDSWEVHTGESGIVLQLRQEGEKLDLQSVSSTKQTVYVYKYGEAIGITDEMIRFRKIAKMFDLLESARDAYLLGKSNIFYTLLTAAAAVNTIIYQGAAGDGEVRRDILSLNTGINALGTRMSAKVANASRGPVILYANPVDETRIEAAFRSQTADLLGTANRGQQVVSRPVRRIYTYNVTSLYPIVIWPGRKNQWAEVLPLTQLTQTDILTWIFIQAYWTYFGGIVADTDQCQQINLV